MALPQNVSTVLTVAETLKYESREIQVAAIFDAVTEIVNKTSPSDAPERGLRVASLLKAVAVKLNVGHTAYQSLMDLVWKLDPPRK